MESLTRGTLVWTGEHWINALRVPGAAEDSGKVSLYCAHHTPAGRGHVASVEIGADSGIGALCTDNPELTSFINETMWANECALPVVEASFQREGNIGVEPVWLITTAEYRIRASWSQIAVPYVRPPTINPRIIFTILFFAAAGSLSLNDTPVAGEPYARDAWAKNLRRPHSSCWFALAETMINELPGENDV